METEPAVMVFLERTADCDVETELAEAFRHGVICEKGTEGLWRSGGAQPEEARLATGASRGAEIRKVEKIPRDQNEGAHNGSPFFRCGGEERISHGTLPDTGESVEVEEPWPIPSRVGSLGGSKAINEGLDERLPEIDVLWFCRDDGKRSPSSWLRDGPGDELTHRVLSLS